FHHHLLRFPRLVRRLCPFWRSLENYLEKKSPSKPLRVRSNSRCGCPWQLPNRTHEKKQASHPATASQGLRESLRASFHSSSPRNAADPPTGSIPVGIFPPIPSIASMTIQLAWRAPRVNDSPQNHAGSAATTEYPDTPPNATPPAARAS